MMRVLDIIALVQPFDEDGQRVWTVGANDDGSTDFGDRVERTYRADFKGDMAKERAIEYARAKFSKVTVKD